MQLIWPLTPITRYEYTPTVDVRATGIEHLYLLQYRCLALKTMYVQFCNEAKGCAYWLVNETIWYETETRPRHLETTSRDRLETETSRPILHPWYTGISSGPNARYRVWESLYLFAFYYY